MERRGAAALQYSVTEGIPEMRRWVAERLTRRTGRIFEAEDVMIVNGSQQGLDLVGKIFLDPGDHVVLETPVVSRRDPSVRRVSGALSDGRDRRIRRDSGIARARARTRRSISEVRLPRTELSEPHRPDAGAGAPRTHRTHLRALRSADRRRRSLRRTALRGRGISASRFVREHRADRVLRDRQQDHGTRDARRVAGRSATTRFAKRSCSPSKAADLHSGTFAQYVFHEYVSDEAAFVEHVATIARTYRAVATSWPTRSRPSRRTAAFRPPQGGMFLWVTVPGIDTAELLATVPSKKSSSSPA